MRNDSTDRPEGMLLTQAQFQRIFLLIVVIAISVLFLFMVRGFIVAVLLAAVFAAMSRPAYDRLRGVLGGRRRAAIVTLVGVLLLVVVPVGAFLTLVVTQTVELSDEAGPWIREQSGRWPEVTAWAQSLPVIGEFMPDQGAIASRLSDVVGRVGTFLIDNLRAATTGTLSMFLQLFVLLYAMYFALLDGQRVLARILYYAPLDDEDEARLIGQFVSVTRATIKGSILVGLIQGALAGAAFFALGLPGAAFWSAVMAVLSVIPVLGSALVWAPASVILIVTDRVVAGIALALWGTLVVGTIDNFLRPRLVGRDTKMNDLMVLLSTFGGLAMFGPVGFILGPLVAALFMTAWDLYGSAFGRMLPGEPEGLGHVEEAIEKAPDGPAPGTDPEDVTAGSRETSSESPRTP